MSLLNDVMSFTVTITNGISKSSLDRTFTYLITFYDVIHFVIVFTLATECRF